MNQPDLRSDETKAQDARVARAVAAERERCAKIAERSARSASYDEKLCAQHIASQIRGS